jgi:hypothetical protein
MIAAQHIVIIVERRWLRLILKLLGLLRFPWARHIAYREVARRIISYDKNTATITVDKPFPKGRDIDYILKHNKIKHSVENR